MDDTLITAREIDLNKKIYKAIKTNLKSERDFYNAMDGKVHNGGKYEYRLYENRKFVGLALLKVLGIPLIQSVLTFLRSLFRIEI